MWENQDKSILILQLVQTIWRRHEATMLFTTALVRGPLHCLKCVIEQQGYMLPVIEQLPEHVVHCLNFANTKPARSSVVLNDGDD